MIETHVEGVRKAAMFLVDLALLVGLASYGRVDKRIMIGAVARWRLKDMSPTIACRDTMTHRRLAPDEERVTVR
jgi:hypothetical protein